jgi:uncharacterized membrane protein YkvA (DUF1232 family)
MILTGALALLVGAILAFAVPGHVGDVSVGAIGVIVMIVGAVVLIAGLPRLRRGSRQRVARRVGGRVVGYQDRVYRTSKGKIFAMVVAVIYIVSPIDIIPDFLLPFGVIDDATAFGWLLFAIGQELSRKRGQAL